MTTADLSVVIPNYNHARFLPRALDAILSQIVAAREVIVLDDSSADDSVAVVEGYARKYPAVRLVRNERNLGVVATINRGIGLAAGTYLLLAGADDYVLPGFFEKALGLLAAHPHAGLACGLDSCQSGEGGRIDPNPGNGWGRAGYFTPDEVCDRLRHTIGGHAAVYRRDALAQQGGFKPELRWYSDWFALLTCAFRHGACHLPEMLAVRMIAPQNYSADAKPGGGNVAVLGAFLDLVTGPAFADVAPFFRRNGAASFFGPDLVRAAARRADCWSPPVLGFLNGFTPEQYAELLADPDATVRELAAFFLGPFWKQRAAEQADRAAE
ncbi:MAG: glycosyltransferase, partial [Gemmataceae bacterium]|nr:glycosyltransferase [Gemmataceae bacterium]